MQRLLTFHRDESGATAIEYGLIAALIAVVCIASIASIGSKVRSPISNAANAM